MSFQLNQFGLTDHAGEKMNPSGLVISARVSADIGSGLYLEGGQAAKFVAAEVGDLPVITKISAGEAGDGVVLFNMQKSKRYANERVELAMVGSIVGMVASTAMNRNTKVAYNPSTGYVASTTGTRIGTTIDIASATGDIVRVLINPVTA